MGQEGLCGNAMKLVCIAKMKEKEGSRFLTGEDKECLLICLP